jgi:trehalose/maltose hydrolase-like predicted phosphorylase
VQYSAGEIGPWGEYEQHISGDISFAARQYFYATQDVAWLKAVGCRPAEAKQSRASMHARTHALYTRSHTHGRARHTRAHMHTHTHARTHARRRYPLIQGIASFYAARVTADPPGGFGFSFESVMGPDE